MTVILKKSPNEDGDLDPFTWADFHGTLLICVGFCEETGFPIMGNLNSHEVAQDGTVTPSVLIKYGPGLSMQWHEFVKLEDWKQ